MGKKETAFMAGTWISIVPAAMCTDTAPYLSVQAFIAALLNVCMIVGIIMLVWGIVKFIEGFAEQQGPEQNRAIKIGAAGAGLIALKVLLPLTDILSFFATYGTSDIG